MNVEATKNTFFVVWKGYADSIVISNWTIHGIYEAFGNNDRRFGGGESDVDSVVISNWAVHDFSNAEAKNVKSNTRDRIA